MRLIDVNALKELEPHYSEDGYRIFYEYEIDNAPTVEVYTEEQVKELVELNKELSEEKPQGEWIEIPVKRDLLYYTGIKYTCSNCGSGNCYGKPPFCMYCGAKMGGKEE